MRSNRSLDGDARVLQCTSHIRPPSRQSTPTLGQKMWKLALMVPVLAVAAAASAGPCLKVRDGTDGTGLSGGYACMRFSETERRTAARLRLQFASPYQAVRAQMSRNGWTIDPEWLRDFEPDAKRTLPVCGQGLDAICHIQMMKGKAAVVLTFSGTNQGLPLIAVEPTP